MTYVVGILNVVTNIFYLAGVYLTFVRRLYDLFGWFVAVFLASSFYHVCKELDVCLGADVTVLQLVDHVMANIAISRAFLLLANYDLIHRRDMDRYRPSSSSSYHTRATPHRASDVLIKTRYADLAASIYTAIVIYGSLAFFGTLPEHAIVVGTGFLIVLLSYILHWRIKVRSLRHRFLWKAMLLALFFTALSTVLFVIDTPSYIDTHPLWHTTSAIASVLFVYGATRHMRVFSVAELIGSFA